MKVLLTTINAKYIHTSLAIRWLYVATRDRFDVSFVEFTLKQSVAHMAEAIVLTQATVVGLSVYIWNVKQTEMLVHALKQSNPSLVLVVGGPEVTYEPAHFLRHWPIDYVVSGEGEFVLGELLAFLEKGSQKLPEGVSTQKQISKTVVKANLNDLAALPSPYTLEQDVAEKQHRVLYFESSRGCPFRCAYCLSSLEQGIRYFPAVYVYNNLQAVIELGVRQIKFLDRTFNLHIEKTKAIFDFLIAHHRPNLTIQFEVYADLLSDDLVAYINNVVPNNYFRFEIGIQSTHAATNQAICRQQDMGQLAKHIKALVQANKVALHLDLIAGLPYESFDRFKDSFNEVFAFGAKEIQLGFLKLLRGTRLRQEAAKYGYVYDAGAPYQLKSHSDLPEEAVWRIQQAEAMVDLYWNSGWFSQTLDELLGTSYQGRYFEFFDELGSYYGKHGLPLHGYQLEDLYRHLQAFLTEKGLDLLGLLKWDYLGHFAIRPPGFWEHSFDKKKTKQLLYRIGNDETFLARYGLTRKEIEKGAVIDRVSDKELLLTIYVRNRILRMPYLLSDIAI